MNVSGHTQRIMADLLRACCALLTFLGSVWGADRGLRKGLDAFDLAVDAEDISAARSAEFARQVLLHVPSEMRCVVGTSVRITTDLRRPWPAELRPELHPGNLQPDAAKVLRRGLVSTSEGGRRILLNSELAQSVAAGSAQAEPLAGFHGSRYQLAVGLVVGELARLFDRRYSGGRLSRTRAFRDLTGWRRGLLGTVRRNINTRRSPDPAEACSPTDCFAINLEYYLMDPDYGRRRPSFYEYFRRFLPPPFPDHGGAVNTTVLLANRQIRVALSPERLMSVHYVTAAPGSSLAAGFGHGMLRLVFRPADGAPDDDGLSNVQDHIVFAYQAFTLGDVRLDYLGGLLGKYPSLPFCYLFTTVQSRYVAGELRELRSWPLLLSDDERRMLLWRLLENYWEYRGSYRFLSRNCATEARDDIKAALSRSSRFRRSRACSPQGIARALWRARLTDRAAFDDTAAAEQLGLYFPERREAKKAFAALRRMDGVVVHRLGADSFLKSTTAAARRELYRRIVSGADGAPAIVATRFYTLETRASVLAQEALMKTALRRIRSVLRRSARGNAAEPLARLYREAEALLRQRLPSNLLPTDCGYGIPLSEELARIPDDATLAARDARLEELRDAVISELRKTDPAVVASYLDAKAAARFYLREAGRSRAAHPISP